MHLRILTFQFVLFHSLVDFIFTCLHCRIQYVELVCLNLTACVFTWTRMTYVTCPFCVGDNGEVDLVGI